MTPDEINRVIAEHLGWQRYADATDAGGECWYKTHEGYRKNVPNYAEDLNAMHEAEKAAFNGDGDLWAKYLDDELPSIAFPAPTECAPAPARAEAFLRTIGKWRDA